MIYLFAGDDAKTKILNYEKFAKTFPKSVDIFSVSRNNFDPAQIESYYSGESLFTKKSVVVFQGILEREEARDFALLKLGLMASSGNDFVFIEGKLNKPVIDAFKKARAEINIFDLSKEKKEKYDNFLVANAFASRDKFHTWLYFRQAVDLGVALDELAGILFWKVKDMLVKKNFSKFKEEELKNFVGKLSYLLPEARQKGPEAESAFEQFLLEAF
ncbi:MAG: hypothetical protein WCT29_02730 [Candidatus Paceibacterota bacterium]|jgi:DNA polymerase III delta subunit